MGQRRTHTSTLGRVAAVGVVLGVVFACYAPTQIVIRLKTNLQSRAPQTTIQVGSEDAYKQGADGDGRIGELVVVPSDKHDAVVEVKVALGIDGVDPNTCLTAPKNPRCVTAKRNFRFADHETRTFDVFLSSACLGIECGPGQSCDARTSSCVDIRENETDAPPPPLPLPNDSGDDAPVTDAPLDVEPPRDGPVANCGPSTVSALEGAPRTFLGTVDALVWLDGNGKLQRRPKLSAGPSMLVDDADAVTTAGNTVFWTKGAVAFARHGAGATGSCQLVEGSRAVALLPTTQPTALPTAVFAAGATRLARYETPSGTQCPPSATFSITQPEQLVATASWVWAWSNINGGVIYSASTTFAQDTNWSSSVAAGQPIMLASNGTIAVGVTRDQADDINVLRLPSPTGVASIVKRKGLPTITGLAADDTYVYWLETTNPLNPSTQLYRARLLPSEIEPGATLVPGFPPQVAAQGLVVDQGCIYTWATATRDLNQLGSIIGLTKSP